MSAAAAFTSVLLGHSLSEVDCYQVVDQVLVQPLGSLLGNIHRDQIQHFQQVVGTCNENILYAAVFQTI